MARHIHALNIDPDLRAHSTEIVDRIARVTLGGKARHVYSFATKYCSWHDQANYPIYDSFVERVLLAYKAQDAFHDFTKLDLRDYAKYKKALEAFRSFYSLTNYSFKVLDKALWLHGKTLFGKRLKYLMPSPTNRWTRAAGACFVTKAWCGGWGF